MLYASSCYKISTELLYNGGYAKESPFHSNLDAPLGKLFLQLSDRKDATQDTVHSSVRFRFLWGKWHLGIQYWSWTALCFTRHAQKRSLLERKLNNNVNLHFGVAYAPELPPMAFWLPNRVWVRGRTLGQSSIHHLARKWSGNIDHNFIFTTETVNTSYGTQR